jgi:hypothetical protein
MRGFLNEIWKIVKYIIIESCSMTVSILTVVVVCIGSLLVTLYWPFYSYGHLNSFVSETQKNYPIELRFASESRENIEQENSILMSGKLYCGAKLINQQVALKNFNYESIKTEKDIENLAAVYQNADKYLCPIVTQVASSR